MTRQRGGFIQPFLPSFSAGSASGVFSLGDAAVLRAANLWPGGAISVEYLVVAGGGSGSGGGGGAGGIVSGSSLFIFGTHSVTVGAGGARATSTSVRGSNGGNSIFSNITALGGGAGGFGCSRNADINIGANGGSGGGGGSGNFIADAAGGTGVTGQGFAGGANFPFNDAGEDFTTPGGGGGAGGPGTRGGRFLCGDGGIGIQSSITGQPVWYGGGGGGGVYNQNPSSGGRGGLGGGGSSEFPGNRAGSPNTGGGGGGIWNPCDLGNAGGSGVVILALRQPLVAVSAGLTYTLDSSSRVGFFIYRFTAGTNGTITI